MMELVVFSAPEKLKNEASIINELFASGLGKLHLRKPDWTVAEITALLRNIKPDYLSRIALHQYHNIAMDFGIRHLHFKENSRAGFSKLLFQSFKHSGYLLTSSVHDVKDLNNMQLFDYVFFGPVFDSISKSNYKSTLSADFSLLNMEKSTKVYAIGGVDIENIQLLDRMNFDGAALLGSIWSDPTDALTNYQNIVKLCS
ncbi:MAG: thiamine phosphate synthase [Pedobacter sp.]|nr:MAG: thiamine phosphate synthase [Pedobacter sp.]